MITLMLGGLALLSLALLLWQWGEGIAFPLHRRRPADGTAPPVTLLKPLKGADTETAACLRSWLAQDYPAPVQCLLAVRSEDDPAVPVVRRLLEEFPQADARLVICPERDGPNSKVSKLARLEPLARHDLLVVSDADVAVPPDFLRQLVLPFQTGADGPTGFGSAGAPSAPPPIRVGLVCALYELATPATSAMHWEAVAVNADFWTGVLQARRLAPLRFALGAVMAVERSALGRAGGFRALTSYLADDYELGRRVAALGARVELTSVVAACREAPRGWRAIWRHQVRWTRTIRHCRPGPFALSLLANPTLWPGMWLALDPGTTSLAVGGVCLAARLAMAAHCQGRLTRRWTHLPWVWLAPVKDLLAAVLWALAFLGHTVEWRGERFRVCPGGLLEPVS